MTGRLLGIHGQDWLADVVEHWPPGGPDDQPLAYDLIYYEPTDRSQWVGNPWIPAEAADLSPDGLERLFREATLRSWRDARGTYWRIRVFRTGTVVSDGPGVRRPDGLLGFSPRHASEGQTFTGVFAGLPPVGTLTDDELERLVPRPTSRTPLSEVIGRERARRKRGRLEGAEIR